MDHTPGKRSSSPVCVRNGHWLVCTLVVLVSCAAGAPPRPQSAMAKAPQRDAHPLHTAPDKGQADASRAAQAPRPGAERGGTAAVPSTAPCPTRAPRPDEVGPYAARLATLTEAWLFAPPVGGCQEVCAKQGLCGLPAYDCKPASAADCEGSCQTYSRCTFRNGRCIVGPNDCRRTESCMMTGLCKYSNGKCIATAASCKDSLLCERTGLCTVRAGACVATDAGCAASDECRKYGECHAVAGRCAIASSRDCRCSEACTKHHKCTYFPASRHSIASCSSP